MMNFGPLTKNLESDFGSNQRGGWGYRIRHDVCALRFTFLKQVLIPKSFQQTGVWREASYALGSAPNF